MSLPLFFLHPQTHIPPSVSMPRCRGRSYILHMLPISLLPVVEHHLSTPSYRTDKWRPATHEFEGTLGIATRTISQIKWIWLLLSWIQRMNVRFSSVSFTSPAFFSFLHASVRYRSGVAALHPPQVSHISYRLIITQMMDFPRPSKGSRPQAIPSCSSAHLSYPMASFVFIMVLSFSPALPSAMTITIFLQPIFPCFAFGPLHSLPVQSFSISYFLETPRVLKLEA